MKRHGTPALRTAPKLLPCLDQDGGQDGMLMHAWRNCLASKVGGKFPGFCFIHRHRTLVAWQARAWSIDRRLLLIEDRPKISTLTMNRGLPRSSSPILVQGSIAERG